jgi:hypothetical protein
MNQRLNVGVARWSGQQDLNLRPSGYEPDDPDEQFRQSVPSHTEVSRPIRLAYHPRKPGSFEPNRARRPQCSNLSKPKPAAKSP